MAASLAALAIALLSLNTHAQTKTNASKGTKTTQLKSNDQSFLTIESDPTDDAIEHVTTYRNGSLYKIELKNEKITELVIDGKKIPEQDFPKYEPMVKKILDQVKRDREQAEKDRSRAEVDRQQADKDRHQADLDRAQAENDRERAEKDRELAELDMQKAARDREQAEQDRVRAEEDRKQADHDRAQAEIDRKHAEEDRKLLAAITNDLISEKVIATKEDLHSLQFSSDGLIVNDKRQPAELFQKLKAKYLKKPGVKINFYNSGNTRQFSTSDQK
ncbi:hypothetical protein [Danxiaibacter flavus]